MQPLKLETPNPIWLYPYKKGKFGHRHAHKGASHVAIVIKNLGANAGDVRDEGLILGWEGPLEEGRTTHSSVLAWRIPWTEEPSRIQSIGSQRVKHN